MESQKYSKKEKFIKTKKTQNNERKNCDDESFGKTEKY